jgi:ribonuclease BN (tRNA processing enzyme)
MSGSVQAGAARPAGSLRFIPVGIGDAFSSLYYSSCLALEAEGAWLLIDCPHPIRKVLREAGATAGIPLDVDRFSAVVLTHLHADHSSGLEGMGFYARFRLGKKLRVYAHPDVSVRLWSEQLAASMGSVVLEPGGQPVGRCLDDFFDLQDLSDQRAVQIGPFAVECRRSLHSIPTTALRVRAAGRCLGYSADTAFDPTLLDWLAAADLVVHESCIGLLHTPYEQLAGLPAGLRARIRLIHCPDDFDRAGSVIETLRQGQSYTV